MTTTNVMTEWKKELTYQSSNLNPEKWCKREDIERVESILLKYFGEDFFIRSNNRSTSDDETHLVIWLLVQKTKTSLTSLFEIAFLLEYSYHLKDEIQKELKANVNNSEQFQNRLFEIYTYKLLDYNRVKNKKGTSKGNQKLEGHCVINSKEFLFECRKSYSVSKNISKDIKDIIDILHKSIKKVRGEREFIGYLKIKELSGRTKQEITEIFKKYIRQLSSPSGFIRAYHECKHMKFETKLHNQENFIEYNSINEDKLIKFRFFSKKANYKNGVSEYGFEVRPQISVKQDKITEKLIRTIDKKRHQHIASKDENRIIFIDCEINNYLKFPLLMDEKMIEEEKIQCHLEKKNTKDIVVIILRNYIPIKPIIKIKVFGKEQFNEEKLILENLKTNFFVR